MRSTAVTFIGLPANAPSRSTTCRWRKPCVSNACACAAGSRLNTVARAMSPCCRRTARPSLRSMAGKRITSRLPFQKIRDQLEPQPLALLGMELRADGRVTRDDGGDWTTVVGVGDQAVAVRLELKRVHEIAVQAVGPERNAVEQRV